MISVNYPFCLSLLTVQVLNVTVYLPIFSGKKNSIYPFTLPCDTICHDLTFNNNSPLTSIYFCDTLPLHFSDPQLGHKLQCMLRHMQCRLYINYVVILFSLFFLCTIFFSFDYLFIIYYYCFIRVYSITPQHHISIMVNP